MKTLNASEAKREFAEMLLKAQKGPEVLQSLRSQVTDTGPTGGAAHSADR